MKNEMVPKSLKGKMTLAVFLLVTVLLSSVAFLTFFYFEKQLKKSISAQQVALISQLAEQVDDKIFTASEQLAIIGRNINPADLDDAGRMQQILDDQKEHRVFFDSGLLLVSSKKKLIAESPYFPGRRGTDYTLREYVIKTLVTGRPCVSNPFLTSVPPHHPSIVFAVPVFGADGKVAAVLAGRHDLLSNKFLGKLANARIGKSGYLYLFNPERTFIMHPDRKRILETLPVGANQGYDRALNGFEGTLENTNSRGVRGLTSFKRLQSTDWILAAHYPLQEAYAPLYAAKHYFYLVLLLAVTLSMVVVWLAMKKLTAPLAVFTSHIEAMPGKIEMERFITIDSGDEISALADAFNGMVVELDKRKAALAESAEIYSVVAQFTSELALWRAPDNSLRYISANCREITGYEESEFYRDPKLLDRIVQAADQELWRHHIDNADETHPNRPIDLRIITKDGEERWLSHSCHRVTNDAGEFLGTRGSFQDITERRRGEQAVTESELKLRSITQAAMDAIVSVDRLGRINFMNSAGEKIFGYKEQEVLGKKMHDLLAPARYHEAIKKGFTTFQSTGSGPLKNRTVEMFALRRDGSEFPVEISISALQIKGEWNSVALIRDITERKEADRKLLQSRAELVTKHEELKATFLQVEAAKKEWERTMDCIGDMVMQVDNEGEIKRHNRAVQVFSGCSNQEIHGRNWTEFLDEHGLNPQMLFSSGMELYHEASKRWFVFNSYPYSESADYEISGIVITILNITELKRTVAKLDSAYTELKTTHAQLLQKEKLASIGQLAAGVAHEINNPIGFVSSNLGTLNKYVTRLLDFISFQHEKLATFSQPELLAELAEKGKTIKLDYIVADAKQLIKESLEGTERVRKIVQDLKTFSRVDEAEYKFADINACLESTINIVWNELKYKATLKKEFGDISQTKCYPQQLNQVFMNLLVNAAHAIEKQGEISVRTWQEAGFINVAVSDTGCGIPVAHLTKIFEPFFTTKEVGKGTGLGLSISYDIVKKHGGEIQVCSEVGNGTTFAVKIPVVEGR